MQSPLVLTQYILDTKYIQQNMCTTKGYWVLGCNQ